MAQLTIPTPARRPRWALPVLLLTLIVVVGLVLAEMVWLSKLGPRTAQAGTDLIPDRELRIAESILKDPGPGNAPAQVPTPALILPPPEGRVPLSERVSPPPAKAPAAETAVQPPGLPDGVAHALGGLIGANLYQAYLNIGFLADAVEEDLYPPAEARKLLATGLALIETTEEQMARLPKDKLEPADRQQLDRFQAIVTPLKTQAKELQLYWDTDKQEHADRFHKARTEARQALGALLGKDSK
jgi:hypothetical protein